MILLNFQGSRGGQRALVSCQRCTKVFDVPAYKFKTGRAKYCSKSCRSATEGVKNYQNLLPSQKEKLATLSSIRLKRTRKNQSSDETLQPHWKGDEVGYHGLHRWIITRFGKPDYCEMCEGENVNHGNKIKYHWANVSGEYKRDRSDFVRLCTVCHKRWDIKRRRERAA